jgi:hypothetical protein
MADYSLATDPFFSLSQEVSAVKEKVADSVFEGYKLQVAQTNDINNRAMQVALHDAAALADLKGAASKGTLETMLAAARTDAAVGATAMATQREVMHQGEFDRNLINGINTQNLNTALINTNTTISSLGTQFGGLGLAYGGAVAAVQSANQFSAVNAVGSAVTGQRFVNTGNANATVQGTTTNSIG